MQKSIIITGGTGLVGKHLTRHLVQRQYKVIILSRSPQKQQSPYPEVSFAYWDVNRQAYDAEAFRNAHAVVNLAGAGVVASPWTDAYKQEILNSRVNSGKTIIKALGEVPNQVQSVVSASAIGWYGADRPGHVFTEDDPVSAGFLGETCKAWEDSVKEVETLGKRLITLRIGIVLAPDGGALAEFVKPLRFRVAGVLANGRQMISWIHVDDLCRMMIYAIENEAMRGVYNAVAPNPVSNATLTHALARAMYGKAYVAMPVPAFVLKLMMGERSIEVLKSTTVAADKIVDAGFPFRFTDIGMAMKNLTAEG